MLHLKKTIVLRSIVIICHCLPVLFFAQSVNAAGLYRVDPYLQNPSETAVTVLCVSMVSVTATVEYFESNGTPIDVLTAETVPIPQTDSFYRVEARITGLEAGTKYSYRVALENNSGETDTSETAVFTTLDAAQDEIHFGVMNDLHDDTLVNETLGGYLQDYGAEFIFYNGDCWNDPWQDNNAKRPLDYLSSYVRKTNHASIPLLYIQGNHEWRAGFAKDMVYLFEADLLDYDDSMYEQQYQHAFTHANIRFIYMDCGEDGDKREDQFRPSRQRQTTWLQQEIAKPEFINARYRILLMHIPIWGSSGHVFADF